ncbi:hypothetical protein CEP51_014184 [Fusarium floridanum]|uniref:Uncharacterized protein n=1 Tax=Fusarium floridanum TaxID=1325733 RepID=A0A428PXV2_9HYPO|nr:hypothetical protein CEP51_014184 [Fusarium floridanum]
MGESACKRYFIVSSMDIQSPAVKVGSIINNLNFPDRPLSTFNPVIKEENTAAPNNTAEPPQANNANGDLCADTPLSVTKAGTSTGDFSTSSGWGLGIFATFLKQLIQAAKFSASGSSTQRVWFSAGEMTTSRFAPSAAYVSSAVRDPAVADFLQRGGHSARVYLIVAVKVARRLTLVRTSAEGLDGAALLGLDLPAVAESTVGIKGSAGSASKSYHKEEHPGPIVFAFEVEQIRLSRKGEVERTYSDRIKGTMLGQPGEDDEGQDEELDITVEKAVDNDLLVDFDLEVFHGVDEDDERACKVYIRE